MTERWPWIISWQIWKRLVLPSSWLHAASNRGAGITGGHSWQPIHFADSSIRGVALSQSLASRLKTESCKAAGTWRNAGKLLPCEGQQSKVDCYLFPLLSDPNSKYAQINCPSEVRELFVTFVHGTESEIIGNNWTLIKQIILAPLWANHHLCFHGEYWLRPTLLLGSPN